MEHSLAEQKQHELMGDADQERFKTLDDNPEAHSRNYTEFLERTKAFSDHHPTPSDRKIYERDSYVAQGTFGEGDQEVAKAQASLRIAGYEIGNTGYKGVDGVLGPKTAAALRQLQTTAGLSPTGKLDRQTAELLERMTALGMKKADIEALGHQIRDNEERLITRDDMLRLAKENHPHRDPEIMKAQASLALTEYDLGPSGVDGIAGAKTKAAIAHFQEKHRLPVTGKLDPETTRTLEEATQTGWSQEVAPAAEKNHKPNQRPLEPIHYVKSYSFVERRPLPEYKPNVFVSQLKDSQLKLEAIGFDLGPSGADGKLGPYSDRAIRDFQRTFRIPETGILDKLTIERIEKEYKSGAVVEKFEQKLSNNWEMPDVMKFGGASDFQKDYRVEPTGRLEQKTQRAMQKATEDEWKKDNKQISHNHVTSEAKSTAIKITGSFEGKGYVNISGNHDGQGLSLGIIQWNIGQGTLQPLLKEMSEKNPELFKEIFGANAEKLTNMLNSSLKKQMEWAKSINTANNKIEKTWKDSFVRLCRTPEFQSIQNDHMHKYIDGAVQICNKYGLKSEVGFSLAFDIVVQNGGIKRKADIQIKKEIHTEEKRLGRKLTEKEMLTIIAENVAKHARPKYISDVQSRKMTIVNQKGTVHGEQYDLTKEYDLKYSDVWASV